MVTPSRFAAPPAAPRRTLSDAEKAEIAAFAATLRVSRETFSPSQARAPKGTIIGGQWIQTAKGILNDIMGFGTPDSEAPNGGQLVESTGPRVLKSHVGMYDEHSPTSTGDDEGVPDIRNDEGMNHDDLQPGAVDPKGRPYGDDVIARANEIHTQAVVAEPKLTEDMRAAMEGSGGELAGLEYRVKNQSSLAKKIRGNVEEGKPFDTQTINDNIKDSVRYTAVFDDADYVSGTQTAIQRLREQGYQVDIKSFYQGPEAGLAYKGVHGQAISPDGVKVELQFHTPASLTAKFAPEMHGIYDKQKLVPKGSAEWEDYEQQMRDYMTGIGFKTPTGADTIT
jgi:hypothetical protein